MEQPERDGNEPIRYFVEDGLVVLKAMLDNDETMELVLGPLDEVCEEMCRFLTEVDYGDCK